MESDIQRPTEPILRNLPPAPGQEPFAAPTPSHTQENPTDPIHTNVRRALKAPDEFSRIFLLGTSVRYIPRGLLGMLFESRPFPPFERAVNRFINWSRLDHVTRAINGALSEHADLVKTVQEHPEALKTAEAAPLVEKLQPLLSRWHTKKGLLTELVGQAVEKEGAFRMAPKHRAELRGTMREGYLAIGYGLTLFLGSSLLSLRYGRLVRNDITNLFREAVAYEKGIPQDKVTFADIEHSDNRIVQSTIKNYHSKLWQRLALDSGFLLSAPLKSMYAVDFFFGLKGFQLVRDTWKRENTPFEDLVNFVNNKISPRNGLGQPIAVGDVFDLYQNYALTFAPERAFRGVIEHDKAEGTLWAENQGVFQRLTELLNKTYAYKHDSIVDASTGRTVLQADFPLPKLIYLLGHDLIDIHAPQKTLAAIELANHHGIAAVKDMQAQLAQGQSLEAALARYQMTLPNTAPRTAQPAPAAKDPAPQFDVSAADQPTTRIDAHTVHAQAPLHATPEHAFTA